MKMLSFARYFTALFLAFVALLPGRALAGGGAPAPPVIQMRSWLFTSQRIDFSSGTAVASTQIAAGQPNATNKAVAASAFNAANQLQFYVAQDGSNRTVYNASNVAIGTLNSLNNPNRAYDESGWFIADREIAIVPVPGLCQRYYIIYGLISNYTGVVGYAEVDCSGASPVLLNNTRHVDPSTFNGQPTGFTYSPGRIGLAVSKLQTNGTRTLYVVGGTASRSYTINVGGGFSAGSVLNMGSSNGSNSEVELSPDGNVLAVGNGNTIKLLNTQLNNLISAPSTINFVGGAASQISGLEFTGDSKKLFITGFTAGASGMAVYTLATTSQAAIVCNNSTTQPYYALATNTQVELAYDGKMYAATSSGSLLAINPATAALTLTSLPAIDAGGSGYLFPDQIDGEDYTLNFGTYAPSITALRVDGQNINASAASTVYSCSPLLINANTSANLIGLTVTVTRTDVNNNALGTYQRTFSYPSLPVSLSAFDGGYLANPANTGYYRVTIAGRNTCGINVQAVGRVWISTLTPTSVSFNFNGCAGTTTPATASSATNPAVLGAYGGGGIDISNTTGDYDTYQVVFEQYTAGPTPTYTAVGSPAIIAKPTTPTGLSTIAPSYLASNAGLAPNYFQIGQPGYGQVYRLTLSVTNACGTSPTLSGHFNTANINCRPAGGGVTTAPAAPALRAYPNPLVTGATGHIAFALPTAQHVSLVLVDAFAGQEKLVVLRESLLRAGPQEAEFDAAKLLPGLYYYRLTTEAGVAIGRITKAE